MVSPSVKRILKRNLNRIKKILHFLSLEYITERIFLLQLKLLTKASLRGLFSNTKKNKLNVTKDVGKLLKIN